MTSAMTTLDVDSLPFDGSYLCEDGTTIDLPKLLADCRPAIEALAAAGLIESNPSFGFAMLAPRRIKLGDFENLQSAFDDPKEWVWFVGGWGPNRNRYIANAVRKLRALLRTGVEDTLLLVCEDPDAFEQSVAEVEANGDFRWGDFPYGGATSFEVCGILFVGAVSSRHQVQDGPLAHLVMSVFASKIIIGDKLLPEG